MISIIGAGPVGNYLAYNLARQGEHVTVFEEHQLIGKPVACTGIMTAHLSDLMSIPEDFLINTITRTDVYAPNGNAVTIKLKKNYIVDRTLFDSYLAELAMSEGVTYKQGKRLLTFEREKDHTYTLGFKEGLEKNTTTLVGADGPSSVVARTAGLYTNRTFVTGHQARVKTKQPLDPNVVEFFLDVGYIGWLVPENTHTARIGVASHKNAKTYFNDLIKLRPGDIIEWQSGVIPVYNPRVITEQDNLYLIGDAATHVKATTYGGIIPAMIAARELAHTITHGGSYEKKWRKKIGKELWLHLMIRKLMDKFTSRDYNTLITLCAQERIQHLIGTYDREFPSKLLLGMLLKEPRFLTFAKTLFRTQLT